MSGIPLLWRRGLPLVPYNRYYSFSYTFLWQIQSGSENANIFRCSKFIFLKSYPWLIILKFKGPIFMWVILWPLPLWHTSCLLILFSILVNTFYILDNVLGVIWSFPPISLHISSPPPINLEACEQLRKDKVESSKYNLPFLYSLHRFWWTS